MDITLTQSAKRELDELSGDVYVRVMRSLRDELPKSVNKDQTIQLGELGRNVRVHTIDDSRLFALYDIRDVNKDGKEEIVVLTLMDLLPSVMKAAAGDPGVQGEAVSRSARIGHQVLHKLQHL
ncbi:MAG TPA: hypothetical protein VHN37_13415 [Actinomycetota bacterium]|nr:hypothetical protein [Actinomycetota bacterium]